MRDGRIIATFNWRTASLYLTGLAFSILFALWGAYVFWLRGHRGLLLGFAFVAVVLSLWRFLVIGFFVLIGLFRGRPGIFVRDDRIALFATQNWSCAIGDLHEVRRVPYVRSGRTAFYIKIFATNGEKSIYPAMFNEDAEVIYERLVGIRGRFGTESTI